MPTAAVLLPIQGVSLIYWWVAGSYLGVDTYSSRSFPGGDGWCEPVSQGLGSHCWGDYYYVVFLVFGQPDPWLEYPNPYPAASLLPFILAHQLGSLTAFSHSGLIIYLASMTSLIGWAVWAGTKTLALENRIVLFSVLTFLSPPLIHAIDRGNSVGFIIPLLAWLYQSLRNHSENQALLAIVLLTVIKPHFAVLLFLYLVRGQLRPFIKGALLGGLTHIPAFLLVSGERFPANIFDWLVRLVSYQNFALVENGWPQNISFSQGMYSIATLLPGRLKPESYLNFLGSNQSLVGPIILVLVLLMITFFRANLTNIQIAILLTSLVASTSNTSWYYYAVFAIPVLLEIALARNEKKKSASEENIEDNSPSKRIDFILWSVSILTLIQLPMYELNDKLIVVTTANLIGVFWIIAYLLIVAILSQRKPKRRKKQQ
jgi:hypothetical protein